MGFSRILIANRGEIAVRIIRAARKLGIETVAVFSEADRNALHVRLADRAVSIGESEAGKSYLNIGKIIDAAIKTGACAIHPGYGFLSDNADFVKACEETGITFIGPKSETISLLGNKRMARELAESVGVSPVPGYHGSEENDAELLRQAKELGFPLLVKAAGGGGGRGIRIVEDEDCLKDAIASARNEALSAFGTEELILEKKIVGARHVEVQILADGHGNVIHLGERECSVQRRYQKLIEESPSPAVDEGMRKKLGEAAVKIAKAAGYTGAGTVEFLVDMEGNFYFLEMNTRLQVEHPVTEMVTGIDLVSEQIKIAEGAPLSLTQDELNFNGCAIEARLYAEDPESGFLPQTGKILLWIPPSGENVRVDHGIETGDEIFPYYDHMLAKIITWGETRDEAIRKLLRALQDCVIIGLKTNRCFLQSILKIDRFRAGEYDTSLLSDFRVDETAKPEPLAPALGAVLLHHENIRNSPFPKHLANWFSSIPIVWEYLLECQSESQRVALQATGPDSYLVQTNDSKKKIRVIAASDNRCRCEIDGVRTDFHYVLEEDEHIHLHFQEKEFTCRDVTYRLNRHTSGDKDEGSFVAEMDGSVLSVHVEEGQEVEKGQVLVTMESMKIEFQVKSHLPGVVKAIHVKPGNQVKAGQLLLELSVTN